MAVLELFNTSGFPPRWKCGTWSDLHGYVHIVADSMIFLAYFAIPAALIFFIMKREDIPFTPVFWLFAAFILACGTGHLIEATLFWHPWYRLSGFVKVVIAVVSWATVIALIPIIPKALTLPGLATVNRQLLDEIRQREAAELKLRETAQSARQSYQDLEEFTAGLVERESRVIELKLEINGLLSELGRPPRFQVGGSGD